jgi:hypothetical protein
MIEQPVGNGAQLPRRDSPIPPITAMPCRRALALVCGRLTVSAARSRAAAARSRWVAAVSCWRAACSRSWANWSRQCPLWSRSPASWSRAAASWSRSAAASSWWSADCSRSGNAPSAPIACAPHHCIGCSCASGSLCTSEPYPRPQRSRQPGCCGSALVRRVPLRGGGTPGRVTGTTRPDSEASLGACGPPSSCGRPMAGGRRLRMDELTSGRG